MTPREGTGCSHCGYPIKVEETDAMLCEQCSAWAAQDRSYLDAASAIRRDARAGDRVRPSRERAG